MSSFITAKLMDICQMQDLFDSALSTLDSIKDPILTAHNVQLFIKRDDKIDHEVSGNKWRKLKYNILQCQQYKNIGILTFGGAYSNHLVATASACKKAGLKSIGIVRGEELTPESNATLSKCYDLGMHLHFISREEYHLKTERYYHEEILKSFPNYYIVPEGGASYWGMIGCQELVKEISEDYHRIVLAQGTTTTSCGILLGVESSRKMSVVPVLKGFDSIKEMKRLLNKSGIDAETTKQLLDRVEVLEQYHFGGYAKYNNVLLEFVQDFHQKQGVKLDTVYTGKALFALFDQIKSGDYDGETIVFIHTGGLQGIHGIEEKVGQRLF